MKCRQCGKRIPGNLLKLEEYSCPSCGEVYRNEPHASLTGRFRRQRRRRSWWRQWLPLDGKQLAMLGGGLLVLILLIAGIVLAAGRGRAPAQPVAAEATAEPVDHSEWLDKAASLEGAVQQLASEALASKITQGEAKVSYIASEADRFIITTPTIVLSSYTKKAMVKEIQALEQFVADKALDYSVGWRATFNDAAGKQSCVATFGGGFSGYTFVMNGKTYFFQSLSDVK